MTRERKIKQDKYIESLLYFYIFQRECYDWCLGFDLFGQVAKIAQCPIYKVKRIFYKKILIEDFAWLINFIH